VVNCLSQSVFAPTTAFSHWASLAARRSSGLLHVGAGLGEVRPTGIPGAWARASSMTWALAASAREKAARPGSGPNSCNSGGRSAPVSESRAKTSTSSWYGRLFFPRLEKICPISGRPRDFFSNPLHRLPESFGRFRQPAHPASAKPFWVLKCIWAAGVKPGRGHASSTCQASSGRSLMRANSNQGIFGLNQFKNCSAFPPHFWRGD